MALTWYALHTKPRRELSVAKLLRKRGYDVFVPVCRVPRAPSRHQKGSTTKLAAMVEGYVFVAEEPYHRHKWIRGVLLHDRKPARITALQMRPLMIASGAAQASTRRLTIGEIVQVGRGPFAGQTVTIGAMIRGRVEVIMEVLGAPRTITLDRSQIAA